MKRIGLDQMKNMSIDNLIELYRDGYRIEEHTPITSLSNLPNFSNIHTLQGPLLDPVVNFGKVTVSTGYDAVATSIILNTNEGSKLPVPSVSGAFNLVWWNSTDYPDPSDDPNKEIVRCTAKTTDTLTVTRPQEGTSVSIKNLAGKTYKMILSPTAKTVSDISSAITARVVKSGDTMTGTLNLPSNGLIVGTNQLTVSGGNVGIGTTSPIAKLDIQVDTDAHISFGFTGAIASGDGYLRLGYDGINEYGWISPYLGGTGIKDLILQPWGGNVGIGTTNPGYRSDVDGSFRVSGAQAGASSGVGIEMHYDSGNNKGQIYVYDRTAGIPKLLTLQEAGGDINLANGMFLSNYNVGIGTTTPATKLEIAGGNLLLGNSSQIFWRNAAGVHDQAIRIYGSSANNLILTASAMSDAATILPNGNVGIGTTSPGYPLHIYRPSGYTEMKLESDANGKDTGLLFDVIDVTYGNAIWKIGIGVGFAGNGFGIYEGSPNPGTRMVVTSGGSVGIGTTSPGARLDVSTNSTETTYPWNTGQLRITNQNTATGIFSSIDFIHGGSINGAIALKKGTGNDAALTFWTNTGTGVSEKVRIDKDGNVGIGTTNPQVPLHVQKSSGDIARFGTDISNYIYIANDGTTGFRIGTVDTNKSLALQTSGGTTRLFIKPTGEVGIGTSVPGYLLDVAGTCHASSFPTSSDIRFKQNIFRLSELSDILSRIRYLNGISFEWNQTYQTLGRGTEGKREIGLIAQEVEQVFPELISTFIAKKDNLSINDAKSIDYGRLTAILVEGIKELASRIDYLESRLSIGI